MRVPEPTIAAEQIQNTT